MLRHRIRILTGTLVVIAGLVWAGSPGVRAAGSAMTGTMASVAATVAATVKAISPGGAPAQKQKAQGQTVKQKKQLAIDRQKAAKKATAKGLTVQTFGAAAMAAPGTAPHYYSMANWANSPLPMTYGNSVVARTTPTDGAANVLVLDTAHPLPSGTLVSFSYFADPAAAGNTFHVYVLRPGTTAGDYLVAFDSGPITVPAVASGAIQVFTLANAIPVQAGDVIGHYGPGIPIDIGAGTDSTYWPAAAAPTAGGTFTPGGADYPILAQARTYSLAANLAGLRKFVDTLPGVPGVTPFGANNLGQSIPVAVAEEWCSRPEAPTTGCVSADYYEIALVQHREQMHSDLPPTLLREYRPDLDHRGWRCAVERHARWFAAGARLHRC